MSDPPARSRGVIALHVDSCTSCMLCARDCPDWCITIDAHQEQVAVEGARPRTENVLDRFDVDFSLCLYCGICVEVCPFDALFWAPSYDYPAIDIRDLLHDRDRLGGWLVDVAPGNAVPTVGVDADGGPRRPADTTTGETCATTTG